MKFIDCAATSWKSTRKAVQSRKTFYTFTCTRPHHTHARSLLRRHGSQDATNSCFNYTGESCALWELEDSECPAFTCPLIGSNFMLYVLQFSSALLHFFYFFVGQCRLITYGCISLSEVLWFKSDVLFFFYVDDRSLILICDGLENYSSIKRAWCYTLVKN